MTITKKAGNSTKMKGAEMTGEWIPYEDPDWNAWKCSKCGAVQYLESGTPLENEWLYCPHCGKRLYEEMTRETFQMLKDAICGKEKDKNDKR